MAERIDVLFVMETLEDRKDVVGLLDGVPIPL